MILGTGGVLQCEVVASRLANEYGVDAMFESTTIYTARWVSCDDPKILADFEQQLANNLARDAADSLSYMATSRVNLQLTQERWPKIIFHETREHAVTL